ncbi:MAG TPA: methionine biosynthesis protein MetW [Dongiaceae bacterium]|jgi:methionine biosynthesis protein MetW|nr:methionine biosynthesis protein MetW [Dongiaceae bacterium]
MRIDLEIIVDMIQAGSRVLDLGCGDGALLAALKKEKQVDGRGLELSQAGVNACVARGLSVIQGDADSDLRDYPADAFDYVVLSQTLQATRDPSKILDQLARIGRRAIVSFPNFGHWRVRLYLGVLGRMPETKALPWSWYNTPNIHLCTIRDFIALAHDKGLVIERALAINAHGSVAPIRGLWGANLMGEQGLFLLRRRDGGAAP